ncbi:MAG: DUF2783 domain-containing protein [Pseudomonadota bacterium]
MHLISTPNLARHDDFYEALLAAHRSCTADESAALNAQLVLILANHIGDLDVLTEALDLAKRGPD